MKILLRLVLVLVLLFLLAVGVAFAFIDPLIEKAVEKGATHGTGVATELGSADAGIFSGELQLEELTVANPPGFRAEPFLRLGLSRAQWDNRSLLSDAIEVEEFVLDGVEVNLERTGSGSNWGVILANLEKLSSKDAPPPADEARKTLHVGHIEIRDVKASLHLSGVPLGAGSYSVEVPKIVVDDFRSDGTTSEVLGKLTRALVEAILGAVVKGGAGILPQDVLSDLGGRLDELRGEVEKQVGDALRGVEGEIGGKVEQGTKKVEEALESVGDIFGKKKKD